MVVLTWALDAMASLRVFGEKSLSFTFELFEALESLENQGVRDLDRDRELWDREGVADLSSKSNI